MINSTDIIKKVAGKSGMSEAAIQVAMDYAFAEIEEGVLTDGYVQIVGYGRFTQKNLKARHIDNPRYEGGLDIPAIRTIRYLPSREQKDRMNNRMKLREERQKIIDERYRLKKAERESAKE